MTDRTDRGSVTAFVVMLTLTFAVCAGLAVDGGRAVAAKAKAADLAENAARAGAQEITGIRAGARRLDQRRARATALSYLAAHGVSGTVTVTASRITVTVSVKAATSLLHLAGVGSRQVHATRSSEPVSP